MKNELFEIGTHKPMKNKHTKEPWRIPKRGEAVIIAGQSYIANMDYCGGDSKYNIVANVPTISITEEQSEANANRVVACVNACEGINPEAVPELLAECKRILAWFDLEPIQLAEHNMRKGLRAIIAKATD